MNIKKSIIIFTYLVFLSAWIFINLFSSSEEFRDYFADTYGLIALVGGAFGIYISISWGGTKSLIGKVIFYLSLGLLFQFLGQLSYSIYYYVFNLENPYPSIGDIFYLGSVFFYIYGVWLLAHLNGSRKNFSNLVFMKKLIVVAIPLMMIIFSYFAFLQNYTFEGINIIKLFLDFAYPFGQALFLSLAILSYFLSYHYLGGVMKPKILIILLALTFQYIADSFFLYQSINDTWIAGGFGDLLFLTAYFVMSIALVNLDMNSVGKLVDAENLKQNGTNAK